MKRILSPINSTVNNPLAEYFDLKFNYMQLKIETPMSHQKVLIVLWKLITMRLRIQNWNVKTFYAKKNPNGRIKQLKIDKLSQLRTISYTAMFASKSQKQTLYLFLRTVLCCDDRRHIHLRICGWCGNAINSKLNIRDIFLENYIKVVVITEDAFTKDWLFPLKYGIFGIPQLELVVDDLELIRCYIKIRKRKSK